MPLLAAIGDAGAWASDHAAILLGLGGFITGTISLAYTVRVTRRRDNRKLAERVLLPLQAEVREVCEPFQAFDWVLDERFPAFGGMKHAHAWKRLQHAEPLLCRRIPAARRAQVERIERLLSEVFVTRGAVGKFAHEAAVAASVRRFAEFRGYRDSWGTVMVSFGEGGVALLPEVLWFSGRGVDEWAAAIANDAAPGRPWRLGVHSGGTTSLTDDAGVRAYLDDICAALDGNPEAQAAKTKIAEARRIASELDAWLEKRISLGL